MIPIAVLAWWALILLLPNDTFPTSHGYDAFASFAPEYVWGAAAAVAVALWVTGAILDRPRLQRVALMFTAAYFVFAAGAFFSNNPSGTGSGTQLVIGLAAGWEVIRGAEPDASG